VSQVAIDPGQRFWAKAFCQMYLLTPALRLG
jgi:hypothetical protein